MIKLRNLIKEEKGDLLALVGKSEDDDLTDNDMRTIGRKVADMEGEELQSYLGMIKALGGYYGGRGEGKETLDKMRQTAMDAYNKAKEQKNESVINEASEIEVNDLSDVEKSKLIALLKIFGKRDGRNITLFQGIHGNIVMFDNPQLGSNFRFSKDMLKKLMREDFRWVEGGEQTVSIGF